MRMIRVICAATCLLLGAFLLLILFSHIWGFMRGLWSQPNATTDWMSIRASVAGFTFIGWYFYLFLTVFVVAAIGLIAIGVLLFADEADT